jgi:hypothetical protein
MRVGADDVICGPAAPAGRRAPAGRHLEQVMARARAYNADPGRLLTIARITILRRCLEPAGCGCGGLDLAVSAVRREGDPDLYVRQVLAYARASGRRFGAFHEMLYWPDRELLMILKNRSPAITVTGQEAGRLPGRLELVYAVSEPSTRPRRGPR